VLARLLKAGRLELLKSRGVPETWRRWFAKALRLIDYLDERFRRSSRPLARQDPCVALLQTVPGVDELNGADDRDRGRRIARFKARPAAFHLCDYPQACAEQFRSRGRA